PQTGTVLVAQYPHLIGVVRAHTLMHADPQRAGLAADTHIDLFVALGRGPVPDFDVGGGIDRLGVAGMAGPAPVGAEQARRHRIVAPNIAAGGQSERNAELLEIERAAKARD